MKPDEKQLLAEYKASSCLGQNSESFLFSLQEDGNKVLRIYKKRQDINLKLPTNQLSFRESLERKKRFYDLLSTFNLPINTPHIHQVKNRKDIIFTIEKFMPGANLRHQVDAQNSSPLNNIMLIESFFTIIDMLQNLNQPWIKKENFGAILAPEYSFAGDKFATWDEYLCASISGAIDYNHTLLHVSGIFVDDKFKQLIFDFIKQYIPKDICKTLVHGEFSFENCLTDHIAFPLITGIQGFSEKSLIGDPMLEIAGALFLSEMMGHSAENYMHMIHERIAQQYDSLHFRSINLYRVYYSLMYINDDRYNCWATMQLMQLNQILDATCIWPPRLAKPNKTMLYSRNSSRKSFSSSMNTLDTITEDDEDCVAELHLTSISTLSNTI